MNRRRRYKAKRRRKMDRTGRIILLQWEGVPSPPWLRRLASETAADWAAAFDRSVARMVYERMFGHPPTSWIRGDAGR